MNNTSKSVRFRRRKHFRQSKLYDIAVNFCAKFIRISNAIFINKYTRIHSSFISTTNSSVISSLQYHLHNIHHQDHHLQIQNHLHLLGIICTTTVTVMTRTKKILMMTTMMISEFLCNLHPVFPWSTTARM